MLKRLLCLLLILLCAFTSFSTAEVRKTYPDFYGYVCDDAAVLSQQIIDGIEALNEQLFPCQIYVYTCHFLGGDDVNTYSEELFNELHLDADDVLLTIVVGEEKYALYSGEMVNNTVLIRQALLSYNFAGPFMKREYDRAVGDFLLAFAPRIAGIYDVQVDTAGLFGTQAQVENDDFVLSGEWWNGFFGERYDQVDDYIDYEYEYVLVETVEQQHLGLPILLILLLVLIIRQRRENKKKGLGVWGWIVAIAWLTAVLRFVWAGFNV